MEPYCKLLQDIAKASDSITLPHHSDPPTGFFQSLAHGHFFNSYINFIAILCEPIIVALANIPFKCGTVIKAYMVATWMIAAILFMMLISIVWMLCRKKTPNILRRPDSIASVMLSLCGSHMLDDLAGMAMMRSREVDRIVRRGDSRYAMGNLVGLDGVEREAIDESLFIGHPDRYE